MTQTILNKIPTHIKEFIENYRVLYAQENDGVIALSFRIQNKNFLMTLNEKQNLVAFSEGYNQKSSNDFSKEYNKFKHEVSKLGYKLHNEGIPYDDDLILHEVSIKIDKFDGENFKKVATMWKM